MTIRTMCDSFGVTPRTLRFYAQKELIAPLRRGRRRLCTRRDRALLTLIRRRRRLGFRLEDICRPVNLRNMGNGPVTPLRRTCERAQARLAVIGRQRNEPAETIAEMEAQIAWGARMPASVVPAPDRGQAAAG